MMTITRTLTLMALCLVGCLVRAQSVVSLQRPLVIPSAAQASATAQTSTTSNALLSLDDGHRIIPNTNASATTPVPPSARAATPAPAINPAPVQTPAAAPRTSSPVKHVKNAEMVTRMRMAVERIAAEYGNPSFAHIFTNDPLQAQLYRKRIQLVQRMDVLRTEIDALEQQKLVAKNEADATRRELHALQQQAETLASRIQQARTALMSLAQ